MYLTRDPRSLIVKGIEIPIRLGSRRGIPPGSYYCLSNVWEECLAKAPLNERAWVFQERLLAPRVLNFSTEQIFWECMQTEACEMFLTRVPSVLGETCKQTSFLSVDSTESPLGPDRARQVLGKWFQAVKKYTNGRLTYQHDKLALEWLRN